LGGSLKAARLGKGHAVAREGFGDGFSLAKHIPVLSWGSI
jgi:hypothetical protein